MTRIKSLTILIFMVLLPAPAYSASVYETQAEFLVRAFGDSAPEANVMWLSGERKKAVRQLLDHDYPALRVRYWCQEERSAWVLEEIGKELPITVGIIVERTFIRNLKVLTYRENRGGEVATPAFTDQFIDAKLGNEHELDTKIDGISGATLSVRALTRLASMALFLHAESDCHVSS